MLLIAGEHETERQTMFKIVYHNSQRHI